MKQATPQLIALLASNQFLMADLYTITLATGQAYRYTNYDYDLTIGSDVYLSNDLIIERGTTSQSVGVEVDSLDVTIYATPEQTWDNVPVMQVIHNGGLDGARFGLKRVFMPLNNVLDTSSGAITLFDGRVSDVEMNRTEARLSVVSDLELLNVQVPRNTYQPACLNTLFDGACGLSKAAFALDTTVTANSTTTAINCQMSQPDGYYTQGVIEFLSGANQGVKRTIRQHINGSLMLGLALKTVPSVGDQIKVVIGCDKTLDTCTNRFNNRQQFRGYPFIPVAETSM